MSPDTRILNLTRNIRLKPHQAEARIAANVSEWVESGKTIRDLSLSEIVALRAKQARHEALRELPDAEIPGLKFVGPRCPLYAGCVRAAYEFASECRN